MRGVDPSNNEENSKYFLSNILVISSVGNNISDRF